MPPGTSVTTGDALDHELTGTPMDEQRWQLQLANGPADGLAYPRTIYVLTSAEIVTFGGYDVFALTSLQTLPGLSCSQVGGAKTNKTIT